MGRLQIMDRTGDTEIEWDSGLVSSTGVARRAFEEHIRKGCLAYSVGPDGRRGVQIREFDASAERIILSPAMRGG